ncbi:prepilin-type N-terminal cleavage/methylation domain-containing protein [Microbacterium sp. NPDC079995]|uniref:type II secretion system protein n=1 Tax=unclassified Microbacterium TaxID=2609290 RepID=UPI00344C1988
MKNYLDALKRRKEETGESGFSLIELIVVVVILGILAAIAVPVFLGLQDQAETSALESVAGNAASQVASDVAQGDTVTAANSALTSLGNDGEFTFATTGSSVGDFCVTATRAGTTDTASAGPGC